MLRGTPAPIKVCLVIIFNHRFDKNINILHNIYAGRFENIFYLMPFYDGTVENVIPVYYGSDTFQGYVAQAVSRIPKDFSHYVFIADDMLLKKDINENNILKYIDVSECQGYIKSIKHISDINISEWKCAIDAVMHFSDVCYRSGFSKAQSYLPSRESAISLFEHHGVSHGEIYKKNVGRDSLQEIVRDIFRRAIMRGSHYCSQYMLKRILKQIYTHGSYTLPYPLAMGYSDFFVIPHNSLKKFAHFCGIFAAMGVFVEVAIPTAMLLSLDSIVYEGEVKGLEIWYPAEVEDLRNRHGSKLSSLYEEIEERNLLYIHPIKLTQWS